ncbi:hypothetical protein M9435_004067 [Picochlorum sp. BPE23]|nr:hypothetical protein M9435_004067 [Picochlorum sp. BPE23]
MYIEYQKRNEAFWRAHLLIWRENVVAALVVVGTVVDTIFGRPVSQACPFHSDSYEYTNSLPANQTLVKISFL